MSVLNTSMDEILDALEAAEKSLPDLGPGDWTSSQGVNLHQIEIVDDHWVLIAAGHVPFEDMFLSAMEFEVAGIDDELRTEYDIEDPDHLVEILGRLSYRRVKVTDNEGGGFDIDWFSGITPITVWQLPHE